MLKLTSSGPALTGTMTDREVGRLLVWPLLAMALLWTFLPALVHSALPLDVVESGMWGREWVTGTYKHPGMPSWFIEAGRGLNGGAIGWPVYATGQLFDVTTLVLTFLLARDLAGPRVAAATVFALLGVEYFSWRSVEFNHTQAQMPFCVASAWCAWRAAQSGRLGWWFALGATAALGLYAKLSNALELIVIAGWIVALPRGRRTLATPGPWSGALVFLLMCVPLGRWLIMSNFQALTYASERGQDQSLMATLKSVPTAVLQFAPVGLVLAGAEVFARATARAGGGPPLGTLAPEARTFLLVIAVLPPLLSVVAALLGGADVRAHWLAPAFPALAVLLAAWFAAGLTDHALNRLSRIGLGIAVGVPLAYAALVPRMGRFAALPHMRVNWPQQAIARALGAAWTAETGKPLRIIAGPAWMAGLVGLENPGRPSILTEGELAFSPWITPERLKRDGALAVWSRRHGTAGMPALVKLIAGRPVKEVHIPFERGLPGHEVVVQYVIVPPA